MKESIKALWSIGFGPCPSRPTRLLFPLCNRPKNYYGRVEGVAQRNGQPSQVQLPRNIRHRHELSWGCLLLTSITYALARERGVAPLPEIAKHLGGWHCSSSSKAGCSARGFVDTDIDTAWRDRFPLEAKPPSELAPLHSSGSRNIWCSSSTAIAIRGLGQGARLCLASHCSARHEGGLRQRPRGWSHVFRPDRILHMSVHNSVDFPHLIVA